MTSAVVSPRRSSSPRFLKVEKVRSWLAHSLVTILSLASMSFSLTAEIQMSWNLHSIVKSLLCVINWKSMTTLLFSFLHLPQCPPWTAGVAYPWCSWGRSSHCPPQGVGWWPLQCVASGGASWPCWTWAQAEDTCRWSRLLSFWGCWRLATPSAPSEACGTWRNVRTHISCLFRYLLYVHYFCFLYKWRQAETTRIITKAYQYIL